MLTELLIYHCDEKDDVVYGGQHLLSNEQLSELIPGSFFYYRKLTTKQDIDQPCDTTQLFMVVTNGFSTTINHIEDDMPVENHVSVLDVTTGEIYHADRWEWVHYIELVNLQVLVK